MIESCSLFLVTTLCFCSCFENKLHIGENSWCGSVLRLRWFGRAEEGRWAKDVEHRAERQEEGKQNILKKWGHV